MTFSKNSMNQNSHQKIIFVTLDGFRKDKVDFCPTLKSYVNQSIVFSNMMTVAPYTSCCSPCDILRNVSF